jgi:hypothetical protein
MSTLLRGHSKSGNSNSSRILFEPYEEDDDDDDADVNEEVEVDEGEGPPGTNISWGSISGTSSVQKPFIRSIVSYVLPMLFSSS